MARGLVTLTGAVENCRHRIRMGQKTFDPQDIDLFNGLFIEMAGLLEISRKNIFFVSVDRGEKTTSPPHVNSSLFWNVSCSKYIMMSLNSMESISDIGINF